MTYEPTPNREAIEYIFALFERLWRREISPDKAKEEAMSYLGGYSWHFPKKQMFPKYVKVKAAIVRGEDHASICSRYGVSSRYVRMLAQEIREAEKT